MSKPIAALTALTLLFCASKAWSIELSSDVDASTLRQEKVTPLGLYLTSEKANSVLAKNPEILFIDVRDPLEVALIGHPAPVDAIVPVRIQSDVFVPEMGEYKLVPNDKFLEQMEEVLATAGRPRGDILLITCGSGYRSAEAVRRLAAAGYTNVWHVPDGYAGDEKPGMNSQNAWLNAGLPWSGYLVPRTPWLRAIR